MKPHWSGLEHSVWKNLVNCKLADHDHFLLAVSGGLDSIVLLEVFLRLLPNINLKIVYFHHGDDPNATQVQFRDECLYLIKNQISKINKSNITFISARSPQLLISEAQYREARLSFIDSVKNEHDIVVTAHHLDDRFETLLLKLIRGTSLEGAQQFKMWNGNIFRPFLNLSKYELQEFAELQNLKWLEDPSNTNTDYFRNWIREKWLKDLENYHAGARNKLAQSLFKILENQDENREFEDLFAKFSTGNKMNRQWFTLLTRNEQLRALALLLKNNQITHFSTGQLEEIRKRLDKNQKDITFQILDRKWVINASQIVLS